MPIDSFSGKQIPKGKGLMYVLKDGKVYWFANRKSEKNFTKLGRIPHETKWTDLYHRDKAIRLKSGKNAKPVAAPKPELKPAKE